MRLNPCRVQNDGIKDRDKPSTNYVADSIEAYEEKAKYSITLGKQAQHLVDIVGFWRRGAVE
jgi:hypothetical protein